MNSNSLHLSISRALPLVFALAAVFIWASIANAQTESQTYTPVDTPVAASGTSAGSDGGVGAGGAAANEAAGVAAASADGGEGEGSNALGISLLPTTGGPLLPLIGLGAIALGATGLLARNRYGRR